LNEESFDDAARRPHVEGAGRVATGGGVVVLVGASSALRFGFDRRFGRGGGALISELVVATALWGLLAMAGDMMEDGRGGGGGGCVGLPIDTDGERLVNE
jgi:hypothetical protein